MQLLYNNIKRDAHGEIMARDILITTAITLATAIVIIIAFTASSKQKNGDGADQTDDLINQIKNQAANEDLYKESDEAQGIQNARKGEQDKTITGVISEIQGNIITVVDDKTKQTTQITIKKETIITYNNEKFEQSDLYKGDKVTIQAKKKGSSLEAASIVVAFSASEKTPSPIPKQLETRPDGTLKPLGNN